MIPTTKHNFAVTSWVWVIALGKDCGFLNKGKAVLFLGHDFYRSH